MDAEPILAALRERLPPARTMAHLVGLAVLLAAVAPFVVYAVPQLVGASHSFVVVSGSMEPTISAGDVVVVESVPAERIEEGDVVTFRQGSAERPTTHRVIDRQRTADGLTFETKGDANENPDRGHIDGEDVVGRVAFTIPLIGHAIGFVNTPIGLFTFLGLPVGLFVLLEVASLFRSGTGGSVAWTSAADGGEPTEGAERDRPPAPEPAADGGDEEAVALTATDVRASLVVLAALAAYSGWTAVRSFSLRGAPDPVSAAVCAGSVTALAFGLALHRTLPERGPTAAARAAPEGHTAPADGMAQQAGEASEPAADGTGTAPQPAVDGTGDAGGEDGPVDATDGPADHETVPSLEDPATFGAAEGRPDGICGEANGGTAPSQEDSTQGPAEADDAGGAGEGTETTPRTEDAR